MSMLAVSRASGRRMSAGLALIALLCALPLGAQEEPANLRIQENDTVDVRPGGDAAVVDLTLARAPAASEGATLDAVSGAFVFWSLPLQRQGNQWRAQIPSDQIETLLIAERLVARFPAGNEQVVSIAIPRDRFVQTMDDTAAVLRDRALFFAAPEKPELPEIPSADIPRIQAASFALQAQRVDYELAKYMHEFAAARSRAHGLFLDLTTSGRLPWEGEARERLGQNYQPLAQQEQEIARQREQWRASARQFVQQWNSTHSGEEPLTLNFAEAS